MLRLAGPARGVRVGGNRDLDWTRMVYNVLSLMQEEAPASLWSHPPFTIQIRVMFLYSASFWDLWSFSSLSPQTKMERLRHSQLGKMMETLPRHQTKCLYVIKSTQEGLRS